jgi:hypothetical protein
VENKFRVVAVYENVVVVVIGSVVVLIGACLE